MSNDSNSHQMIESRMKPDAWSQTQYNIPVPDLPTINQWYQFSYDSRLGQSIGLVEGDNK